MLQALYTRLSVSNCQPQSRLNSPANRLCYKLSRRRQSVPGTCSRHREGVITECWAARWQHDQRRCWSKPETPTNFYISRLLKCRNSACRNNACRNSACRNRNCLPFVTSFAIEYIGNRYRQKPKGPQIGNVIWWMFTWPMTSLTLKGQTHQWHQ